MQDTTYQFIIVLGREAQKYGVSSVRLRSYLRRVSKALGLKADFIITPSYIQYFLQRPDQPQLSYFLSTGAATFDMDKLTRVNSLVDRVASGELELKEAEIALEKIGETRPVYGTWPVRLGYILSGIGFALLLSASWTDVLIAALLNAVVYGLVLISGQLSWLTRRLEFASALVAGALANILAWFLPGSNAFITTLCGVVVLLPGWGLTVGLAEITGNMIDSGLQRLSTAIITSVKLFIGAMIGSWIVSSFLVIPPAIEVADKANFWSWAAVLGLMVGLSIIFQVRRNDFIWTMAGGLLAYLGTVIGAQLGYWQGSFIGALALGSFAYLFGWRCRRPSSIVMLTGVMILVPGAAAYLGFYAGVIDSAANFIEVEWKVFVNAMAIIAGLVVPYTILTRNTTL